MGKSSSKNFSMQQVAQFAAMANITKADKKSGAAGPEGNVDRIASAASLWGPDDDVGSKM